MRGQEYYYNTLNKNSRFVDDYKYEFDPNTIVIKDRCETTKIEYRNRLIASPIQMGATTGGTPSEGLSGDWWSIVQQIGQWYQSNVHTYQGTTSKPRHPSMNLDVPGAGKCRDDCSGFVTACVLAFLKTKGIEKPEWNKHAPSTATMQPGSDWDRTLQANGWQYIPFSESTLQVGDIYCGPPATHVEICAGRNPNKQYGWGSIHDGLNGNGGMPCGAGNYASSGGAHKGKPYQHIWRKT